MLSAEEKDVQLASAAEGMVKAVLSNLPIIGTLLSESFFDVRSRIRQERLNKFCSTLSQVILDVEPSVDLTKAQMDERFADLLESTLTRAARTSAAEKHARLAKALIAGIGSSASPSFEEQFLDLIMELNETQIHILYVHARIPSEINESFQKLGATMALLEERRTLGASERESQRLGYANNSSRVDQEVRKLENDVREMQMRRSESMKVRGEQHYGLDQSTFEALKYALIGRGLLMDIGVVNGEFKAGEILSLTAYGRRFLDFIQKPGETV